MSDFITIKFENQNRRYEFNKETLQLTIIDSYLVDKNDLPKIIEHLQNESE